MAKIETKNRLSNTSILIKKGLITHMLDLLRRHVVTGIKKCSKNGNGGAAKMATIVK